MKLFIDSTNLDEIKEASSWGIIDGVTTNPALIAKGGEDMEATLRAVLDVSPGDVFCQVAGSEDLESLKGQARWLHAFDPRIIVKLPMTVAGVRAVVELKKEDPGMRIAVTTVASLAQAYLAGKAGADVVALFNGALAEVIDQDVDMVLPVKQMYANYGFKTKVLSCGRLPRGFGEFAVDGTDYCTLKFEFLKKLFEHPFTDKRILGFAKDWGKVFGEKTWPVK